MATIGDALRKALVESGAMTQELEEAVEAGEPVWTTDEMRELFNVEGFAAPFVVVRRKADNVRGTLCFTHSPRVYFRFMEAS